MLPIALRRTLWLLACVAGCARHHQTTSAPPIAPFQQFVASNVDWSSVRRVVLMPLANQTSHPKVSQELQTNLAAELQRAGRFDLVVAHRDDATVTARDVFGKGQFDELQLLRVAREYQADAVLFGQVTQYEPYNPPRIGLSLLLVSPAEGIVIASSDGLWDAREAAVADQARSYVQHSQKWPHSLMGTDRAVESPDVFQRFVAQQLAQSWQPPTSGSALSPSGFIADGFVMPASATNPSSELNEAVALPGNFPNSVSPDAVQFLTAPPGNWPAGPEFPQPEQPSQQE